MRIFVIKAGDESTFKELGAYLRELGKTKKDMEFRVEVVQNRPIRSLGANRYYRVVLKLLGIHTGHAEDELHEMCKTKFNGILKELPKSGSMIIGQTTSNLDSKEFAAYVNRVKRWAREEFNLITPEEKDITYQRWMEIRNQYDMVHSGF